MTPDERERRRLGKEIKKLNSANLDELKAGLALLRGDAAPDPAGLPTRQQRRKAERDLQKKRRSP
jgi:hypothetical protein